MNERHPWNTTGLGEDAETTRMRRLLRNQATLLVLLREELTKAEAERDAIRRATADEIAAEIELRRDATVLKDPIADAADKAAFNICAVIARRVGGGGGGGQ
jgi:hypothetical protein